MDIPARLRARHPEEMTIVLQHQFWGLEIGDERFSVTLSFDRVHERLTVPYAAITAFVDPSVQFGLQFPGAGGAAATAPATGEARKPAETAPACSRRAKRRPSLPIRRGASWPSTPSARNSPSPSDERLLTWPSSPTAR